MALFATGLPSLSTPVTVLAAELDQIESVFYASTGSNRVTEYVVPYRPAEDGCLVSLFDAWNRFLRVLLLMSAAGPVEGVSGQTYAPATVRTEPEALAQIRRATRVRTTGGEPKWYDLRYVADLCAALELENGGQIVSAVTASHIQLGPFLVPSPLDEIRECRNFVAHKGDGTLAAARDAAGVRFADLVEHVRSKRSGVELFSDWKESCRTIALAAAQ